jgi:hypothetical protein
MHKTLYGVKLTEVIQCIAELGLWTISGGVSANLCLEDVVQDLRPAHRWSLTRHTLTSPRLHTPTHNTRGLRYKCLKLGYVISTHARTKP